MILYNGATGSVGQYMAGALPRSGQRWHPLTSRLEDRAGLRSELERLNPDDSITLVHLAARVSVPACEADPTGAHMINVVGAVNVATVVLEWAARNSATARVLLVSTGHVYARLPVGAKAAEDAPVGPRSVYARTKAEAESELSGLGAAREVPVLIARVFGLVAPRQPEHYVLPALIRRVREERIEGVPGLDNVRDYLDARDVCDALVELCGTDSMVGSGVVNVCSGEGTSIRDLMVAIADEVGGPVTSDLVREASPMPGRSDDVPWIVGDPSRFAALTGSTPRRRGLQESVRDAVVDMFERSQWCRR